MKDPKGNGLVKKVYDHPLISGLFEGTYDPQEVGKLKRALGKLKLPSYIPARTFALVLLDTALPAKPDAAGGTATSTPSAMTTEAESRDAFDKLRNNISGLDNPEVEKALLSLVDAADNDVAKARENIEKWFDASMDRVSGWYKRRSQVFVFVIGIFLSIGVNADSVLIARRLSADKVMRESLVSAAQSFAKVDAEETAKNAASAKASPSPTESSAKPKPSPSPATSPHQVARRKHRVLRQHQKRPQVLLRILRRLLHRLRVQQQRQPQERTNLTAIRLSVGTATVWPNSNHFLCRLGGRQVWKDNLGQDCIFGKVPSGSTGPPNFEFTFSAGY